MYRVPYTSVRHPNPSFAAHYPKPGWIEEAIYRIDEINKSCIYYLIPDNGLMIVTREHWEAGRDLCVRPHDGDRYVGLSMQFWNDKPYKVLRHKDQDFLEFSARFVSQVIIGELKKSGRVENEREVRGKIEQWVMDCYVAGDVVEVCSFRCETELIESKVYHYE